MISSCESDPKCFKNQVATTGGFDFFMLFFLSASAVPARDWSIRVVSLGPPLHLCLSVENISWRAHHVPLKGPPQLSEPVPFLPDARERHKRWRRQCAGRCVPAP